jgi:hypothetical protein
MAMPNGAPMIDKWTIHSAIIATDEEPGSNGVRRRPLPRPLRTNVRLLARQDIGGEVVAIDWNDGTRWSADLPRLAGVVVDPKGARVAGARVWVRETHDTTTTAADGTFQLPYVLPGRYIVVASDSTMAAAGIPRTIPQIVQLFAPGVKDLWLTLHPRSEVLQLVCPTKSYKPGTGVLLINVVTGSGAPAPAAGIDVETRQTIVAGDSVTRTRVTSGRAGDDGRFVICGAALNQPIAVRATKDGEVGGIVLSEWKEEVVSLTLPLALRRP